MNTTPLFNKGCHGGKMSYIHMVDAERVQGSRLGVLF